jgi:hypothetical protein
MRYIHCHAALALLTWLISDGAWAQGISVEQQYSVPEWVEMAMTRSGLGKSLVFDARLNPFCHRGDFDGDGKSDFAALVKERSSAKVGIAFFHRGTGRVYVVGAGRNIPGHGDDLEWMDAWIVFDKGKVEQGATDHPPPTLKGDALLIFKTEAGSAILWWTGRGYRWYQQGD